MVKVGQIDPEGKAPEFVERTGSLLVSEKNRIKVIIYYNIIILLVVWTSLAFIHHSSTTKMCVIK